MSRSVGVESEGAANRRALAERLLDAAEQEFARTGSVEISLRAVARRAGVSHQAPGFVFDDRAGLLGALATRGMRFLRDEVSSARDAAPGDASPRETLAAVGVAAVLASARRPAVTWLVARPDLVGRHPEFEALRWEAFAVVLELVRRAQREEGWNAKHSETDIAALIWSAGHGLSVLPLGALDPGTEASLEVIARNAMAILFGLD